jgi:hypothetical protein
VRRRWCGAYNGIVADGLMLAASWVSDLNIVEATPAAGPTCSPLQHVPLQDKHIGTCKCVSACMHTCRC